MSSLPTAHFRATVKPRDFLRARGNKHLEEVPSPTSAIFSWTEFHKRSLSQERV